MRRKHAQLVYVEHEDEELSRAFLELFERSLLLTLKEREHLSDMQMYIIEEKLKSQRKTIARQKREGRHKDP